MGAKDMQHDNAEEVLRLIHRRAITDPSEVEWLCYLEFISPDDFDDLAYEIKTCANFEYTRNIMQPANEVNLQQRMYEQKVDEDDIERLADLGLIAKESAGPLAEELSGLVFYGRI